MRDITSRGLRVITSSASLGSAKPLAHREAQVSAGVLGVGDEALERGRGGGLVA
jgi:hypothetical protein